MTVVITDKFIKGARKLAGTIDSSGIINGTVDNFGLSSASGLPTDTPVEITVDRVDSNGNLTPDKEEVIKGIVSGNRIIDAVRGIEGTAQSHQPGAVWEVRLTAHQWEEMVDGIQEEHNPDGSHKVDKIREIVNAPKGFMLNGKIEVTDTGSGLTVALKTLAGADPSASDPIHCRIGDTVRSITSALSRTLADGTNWMNAGSAELATKEIDYFVYLIWDSNSSAVGLGFARIPYGNLVSDFSDITTNEKHLAGYDDFTTTDEVENIGRFAATLSAGAGYTWSVPTFTANNLIQRPIYETRLLSFSPVASLGFSGTVIANGGYKINGEIVSLFNLSISGTSNATTFRFTLPFIMGASQIAVRAWIRCKDNGVQVAAANCQIVYDTNYIDVFSTLGASWTASGLKDTSQGSIIYPLN